MREEDLVSVVVPVYMVEQYLDRCVASIVQQTYRHLEIILIDDGSRDMSSRKCDEWKKKDNRVVVIHKSNEGLGKARNTGIETARGKYVCFVDSDDYILPTMIETVMEFAEGKKSDIVVFGFIELSKDGKEKYTVPCPTQSQYYGKDVINLFLPEYIGPDPETGRDSHIPRSACTCLISMELIKKGAWRFVSEREIISEDIYSFIKLCKFANVVSVCNKALYCYCANENSITHTYKWDRFERNKHFYQECLWLCEELGYPEKVINRCADLFVSGAIGALKQEVRFYPFRINTFKRIKFMMEDDLLQSVLIKARDTKVTVVRGILLTAMRKKMLGLCWLLIFLKIMTD